MSKRTVVSVIALVLAAGVHPGFAQNHGIGGRIGLTFATFGGDVDPNSKTGFVLSGYFIYSFSDRVSVTPELSYVRKGARSRGVGIFFDPSTFVVTEEAIELTTNLDYGRLLAPITLMIPARRFAVRFQAGPAIALELRCSGEVKVETERFGPTGTRIGGESATVSGDCGDESPLVWPLGISTKSLDFGLVFGAGMDVRAGPGAITIDLRYDLGLADIHDDTNGSIKNRAFEILLGYVRYFTG